jgi:hypothetical protein
MLDVRGKPRRVQVAHGQLRLRQSDRNAMPAYKVLWDPNDLEERGLHLSLLAQVPAIRLRHSDAAGTDT